MSAKIGSRRVTVTWTSRNPLSLSQYYPTPGSAKRKRAPSARAPSIRSARQCICRAYPILHRTLCCAAHVTDTSCVPPRPQTPPVRRRAVSAPSPATHERTTASPSTSPPTRASPHSPETRSRIVHSREGPPPCGSVIERRARPAPVSPRSLECTASRMWASNFACFEAAA